MNSPTLLISEAFINETEGYCFGEAEPYEPFTFDIGRLFRFLQKEHGRCSSSVYIDAAEGSKRIGWVFEKRMRYDDARDNSPESFYTRSVWVTLHDALDTVTREHHFHTLGPV